MPGYSHMHKATDCQSTLLPHYQLVLISIIPISVKPSNPWRDALGSDGKAKVMKRMDWCLRRNRRREAIISDRCEAVHQSGEMP